MEAESYTIHVPDDFGEKSSFLVNFSNGQLVGPQPRITLYDKIKDKTKRKKIIVAETDGLAYYGTNFSSDNAALSNSCQYCIGYLDKTSGVMTLRKTELITLNPRIPGTVEPQVGEDQLIPEDQGNTRRAANQMVKVFGSERRKRAYSAAQKNQLDTDVLETALEPAFSHVEANIEKTSSAGSSMQNSGLMPPHNPAAECPQDVYEINDIVSISELKILKSTASEFVNATTTEMDHWRGSARFPEYVLQHLLDLPTDEPHRSLKAAILLYATFLIEMHNMNSRRVQREGVQFEGITPPAEVLEQLLTKFTDKQEGVKKTQYSLPMQMKDKIRLHLLVLCLFLDDFTVECSVLQKDLRVTTNKITDYFKALGCTVQRKGMKRPAASDEPGVSSKDRPVTCVLMLPLAFPKPRKARKRKET